MSSSVGIDVSKDQLDVVVMQDKGEEHLKVENNATGYKTLVKRLHRLGMKDGRVCMEATGTYHEGVAQHLHEAGYRVSVVNPAWVKDYGKGQGRRNKTDRLDAWLIADYCRTQPLVEWLPPSPEIRQLRSMSHRHDSLVKMRQQEINRLKSGAFDRDMLAVTQHNIAFLQQQMTEVERLIHAHIKAHRFLQRLCHLLADISDLALFSSARQLAAFAGLTPERFESGSSVHGRSRLTRFGNRRLRTSLFFPALVVLRSHPFFRAFSQRHLAHAACKMQVIAIVMHELMRIVFGVLKSGQPFDLAVLTS
jgi:transposase